MQPPEIADEPQILDRFAGALHACGVVGEDRIGKLVYLAITSRLLDEPVSEAIKGLSSSGKSYVVEQVTRFFPDSAYIEMTAMSERALVYDKRDFAHRTIVLFEAVALREQREKTESNLTAYFVRSLLSEGRIRYLVTVRDKEGNWTTKVIEKNGPTNLILSTTATSLHGENETRMLSVPTNDSADQTKAVLLETAKQRFRRSAMVDLSEWRRFQTWLDTAEHRVVIPFAEYLAKNIPPVAVRLRRDFKAILGLIEAHAILHQQNREKDEDGCRVGQGRGGTKGDRGGWPLCRRPIRGLPASPPSCRNRARCQKRAHPNPDHARLGSRYRGWGLPCALTAPASRARRTW